MLKASLWLAFVFLVCVFTILYLHKSELYWGNKPEIVIKEGIPQ